MSVVGRDFEELKQFNLAEIYDPSPRSGAEKTNNQTFEAGAEKVIAAHEGQGLIEGIGLEPENQIHPTLNEETKDDISSAKEEKPRAESSPWAEEGKGANPESTE